MTYPFTLTAEHTAWLEAHASEHTDALDLAEAAAKHFGVIDNDGNVVGDQLDDGSPIEWSQWTDAETGEDHPLCDAAAIAHDAQFDGMSDDDYDACLDRAEAEAQRKWQALLDSGNVF